MNELKIFEHPDFGKIRTVTIDDEPYLVGRDVAEVLGYSNPSKAVIAHVDDEDKRFEMLPIADSQNGNLIKTAIANRDGRSASEHSVNQRVRSLQSDPRQQAPRREEVQTLGHVRGSPQHPQARGVHDRRDH